MSDTADTQADSELDQHESDLDSVESALDALDADDLDRAEELVAELESTPSTPDDGSSDEI